MTFVDLDPFCVSLFFHGLLLVIVIMIDGSQERNFMLRSKFQSFHVIEKRSRRCLFSVVPWI